MDTAQAMHDTGLQAAGYEYVNSDGEGCARGARSRNRAPAAARERARPRARGRPARPPSCPPRAPHLNAPRARALPADCWMSANRSADGNQVANPDKFPAGFKAVADFIHGLGLKSGLYTAKGPKTCAGFAASCEHEGQDALQWAAWGIDYVKDDSCSSCRNNDTLDYSTMWAAIQASGREMVLTIEGGPDNAACSRGGCGNAHRVGHDITPLWMSMLSLVDVGSGLWPYAHNASDATYGGWWSAVASERARARRRGPPCTRAAGASRPDGPRPASPAPQTTLTSWRSATAPISTALLMRPPSSAAAPTLQCGR